MPRKLFAALLVGAAAIAAVAVAQTAPATERIDYSEKSNWLCLPGRADACAGDNTATVIQADGAMTIESWKADPKAPIDCFYVYPTVSVDPGVNSDMVPNAEERRVVEQQLNRFGSKCRIYAPMYRQFTLTALGALMTGRPLPGGGDAAAGFRVGPRDVSDAWNWYLQNENKGRGVILIGHSQGSGVLTQLIRQEIDGKPVQKQLVSAMLIGTSLGVEPGKDTGVFKSIPLCRSTTQTGCAISYVSFRDTVPPGKASFFGRTRETPDMQAACTNPAALGGGAAPLRSYLSSGPIAAGARTPPPPVWVKDKTVSTPFVALPGLLSAQCVDKNGFQYLEVHVNADPADPRADDIPGDLPAPGGGRNADWGLHLQDMQMAMGDLVELAGLQGKAWLAKQ